MRNPAGKAFQEAIFKQGIPIAAFEVDDPPEGIQTADRTGRRVHPGADASWPELQSRCAPTPAAISFSSISLRVPAERSLQVLSPRRDEPRP